MRFGFFAHALFMPKTPNDMGFSGSVNGTTKNPGFLDFGFCQYKWALNLKNKIQPFLVSLSHMFRVFKVGLVMPSWTESP